jgi:hypothetical protein
MELAVTIEGIRRYAIHGQPYAVIFYSDGVDRDTIRQAQLSEDALPAGLQVGDVVTLTMIGSIVVGMTKQRAEGD